MKKIFLLILSLFLSFVCNGCDAFYYDFDDVFTHYEDHEPTSIDVKIDLPEKNDYVSFRINKENVIEEIFDEIDDANYKRTKNIPVEDISMTLNYESLSPIKMTPKTINYNNSYYKCSDLDADKISKLIMDYAYDNNFIVDQNRINTAEFTMRNDYGNHIENTVSLLYDYAYFSYTINFEKYNIDVSKLVAGDVLKFTFKGECYTLDLYPGLIQLQDSQIINIELFKAQIINFTASPIPGGGLEIISDDGKNYSLPNYLVYGDNFTKITNIYQNLKLYGTIPYNKNDNKIEALYADEYDPNKVINNQTNDDKSLNNYYEDLIQAMNYTKQGNYSYRIDLTNSNEVKYYIKKDDIEYLYYYDDSIDEMIFNNGCLVELHNNHYAINNGKVRFVKENASLSTIDYLRTEHYQLEEKIISIFENNKPLKNGNTYDNYKISIEAIDFECGGPTYILFDDKSSNDIDIKVELSTQNLFYNPIFDKSLSVEEYVAVNQETASLIELSSEYKLLDKINSIPSDDKYCLEFDFGAIIFYENKYQDINHENIVYYEMSSYPDFSFSKGNYVTQIYISDKEVEFNGITLNNSFNEICNLYKSLGFKLISQDLEWNLYQKDDIKIKIATDCSYIDFSVQVSNILGLEF